MPAMLTSILKTRPAAVFYAPAKRFAEVFNNGLLRGKAIGQSLLEARKELQTNHWVDWADRGAAGPGFEFSS